MKFFSTPDTNVQVEPQSTISNPIYPYSDSPTSFKNVSSPRPGSTKCQTKQVFKFMVFRSLEHALESPKLPSRHSYLWPQAEFSPSFLSFPLS